MKLLNRDDLLKKEDLKIEKVDLGKGEFVFVRQMTGRERDRFEQSLMKEVKGANDVISYERSLDDFRAKLAVQTICNDKGDLILKPEDYALLSARMSAARLERIVNTAQEINRISDQDKEALTKNLSAVQSGSSTSGSAGN